MRPQPDVPGLPDESGVRQHKIPKIILSAHADQAIELLLVLAPGNIGEHIAHAGLDHAQVIGAIKLLAVGVGARAEDLGIQVNRQLDILLGKRGRPLADDIEQQDKQENEADQHRQAPVPLETPLPGVALFQGSLDSRGVPAGLFTHIVHGIS